MPEPVPLRALLSSLKVLVGTGEVQSAEEPAVFIPGSPPDSSRARRCSGEGSMVGITSGCGGSGEGSPP